MRFVRHETAPDHSGDEPLLIDVRDLRGPGHAAVSKHRHPVRYAEDFLEVVRNEDDSEPIRAQSFNRCEEDVDPVLIEHSGRLVENENARIDGDGLGYLHHLLLSDAKGCDNVLRRDRDAKLLEHLPCASSYQAAIDDADSAPGKPAEKDIFFRRKAGASDSSWWMTTTPAASASRGDRKRRASPSTTSWPPSG